MSLIREYLFSSVLITGKIYLPNEETGEREPFVIQRVGKGSGNIVTNRRHDLQLRRHVDKKDAKSPLQLAGRARMKAAVAAWQALDDEQKQVWREKAKPLIMTGFNLCIRHYCRDHPLEEFM